VWIDCVSPTPAEVRALMREFNIDPVFAEELLLPSYRPKVEKRGDAIYIILHFPMLRSYSRAPEQEIDFLVGKNFLITTRYENIDPLHSFAKAFEVAGVLGTDITVSHGGHLFIAMVRNLYQALETGCSTLHRRLHDIEEHIFSVTLTRETINIPVIDTKEMPGGIFDITLYSFSENSADLFQTALRQFVQSGDTKLVLDLRGNPGGYLDAAVDMASYFLPVGDVVVTEDFKGKQPDVDHRSVGYNIFANDKNFKMAILVDQGSASAAEILSGALQQHGVAKLVGTRTFGKGSVQELMDLGGGAELKVTIARWLTPNGTSISDGGLTPDINATTTQADVTAGNDPQMNAAVQYLSN